MLLILFSPENKNSDSIERKFIFNYLFQIITMIDKLEQKQSPGDNYKIVYVTFILLGIGALLPWNMFICVSKINWCLSQVCQS